jgi:protein-disulfide isomerase
MASRKEQKEQARARRLAEEQAAAERSRRNRRMQMLGGVLVGAAIVIGVAIAISSGNSTANTTSHPTTAAQRQIDRQVATLLHGIPQSGAVLGNPKAPVTMTYYGDLECPICRDFTLAGGFSQLVAHEVRQGKVKVIYRGSCTATGCAAGADRQQVFNNQQVAALAAGEQQRFWNFAELFYHEQGTEYAQSGTNYVTESYLDGLARQVPGLDINKWQTDRGSSALLAQVQADNASGLVNAPNGTPTLIMKGPKGSATLQTTADPGVVSYGALQQAISQVS